MLASDTVVNTAKEHSGVQSQGTVITGATNRKLSRAIKTLYWGKLVNTTGDMMLKHENNQQHAVTSSEDAIKWTKTNSTQVAAEC